MKSSVRAAVSVSTRPRSSCDRYGPNPVSMFTAGTSPAAIVRSRCADQPAQSTSPSSVIGSSTADAPRMRRRGTTGGAGAGRSSPLLASRLIRASSTRSGMAL